VARADSLGEGTLMLTIVFLFVAFIVLLVVIENG
jgi:hypothetical protein